MNDEVVLALGELATTLLRSPQFEALNNLFEQQVAHDLLTTKPEEKARREGLYATLQGSRAFMSHLQIFAEDFARLNSPPEAAEEADDPIDDPAVHDF